jgi:hypothetical protein
MPMMIRHEPEIVLPWAGIEVLVEDKCKPADLREVANDLMHLPSWSERTRAMTI